MKTLDKTKDKCVRVLKKQEKRLTNTKTYSGFAEDSAGDKGGVHDNGDDINDFIGIACVTCKRRLLRIAEIVHAVYELLTTLLA